ncbi:autotransporter domain-containing protein [Pontiella sulfatireligans]|uniref:Outer membrane protein B n=1 Tax=Pontiella sulfatireligans TaxID=2750658 RepID=A0A6C2UKZ3_9BACT|nr:autotransporter domain-containing protein [Pontiella sulfatireligans]VGO19856.1 Outer membrane protein B [Pontiella sulfatireligans]
MKRFFSVLAATLVFGAVAFGQYTNVLENGTNQVVDSAWDASGSNIWVGDTTSDNTMGVFPVGSVTNSNTYIGNGPDAENNLLRVEGYDAEWLSTGDLYVGNAGLSNLFRVYSGAVASNVNGYVGALAGASSNNVAVAGDDALWVNTGTLQIGAAGNVSNSVDVYSGGTVSAGELVIHEGNDFNLGNSGALEITGDFDVASQSNLNWNSGGRLAITGGELTGITAVDGANRLLAINGGQWAPGANLAVGDSGADNVLSVVNGGSVAATDAVIGAGANASNNTVLVSGMDSELTVSTLTVGGLGDGNAFYVGYGAEVTADSVVVGSALGADGNTLAAYGSNATLTATSLDLGAIGSGNSMEITDGAQVYSPSAMVGQGSSANSNSVAVSGVDANWITDSLAIGAAVGTNSGNSVSVSDGGRIEANTLAIYGDENEFNLNDGGTLAMSGAFDASTNGFNWNSGSTLSVGGALTGLATNSAGAFLDGSKALVLDGGSHTIATNLIVGYGDSNNSLAITNGGSASNADAYIGLGATAANNSVLVSGGSAWTNDNVYVGVNTGGGNSLTVSNNAWVFVGAGATNLVGVHSGGVAVADGSEMVVGETASVVADGVYVDPAGTLELDGSLTVNGAFDAGQAGFNWNDGADVAVKGELTLNAALDGADKTLSLDGAASSWNRGDDILVDGSNTTFKLLDGATASSVNGVVGSASNDWSNAVLVDGDGSQWSNSGNLTIGLQGSENSLSIVNSGKVESMDGIIGDEASATKNSVLVSGANSLWKNNGNLYVGNRGAGNSLEIKDAGTVESVNGVVGANASSSNNTVLVKGGTWANSGDLIVGDAGAGNTLTVESGGAVSSTTGYVGRASNGNSVSLTGSGSSWSNSALLYVGSASGSNNSVSVGSGGMVYAEDLVVEAGSKFNINNSGTLALASGFDRKLQSNVVWNSTSHLLIGGLLENMAVVTNLPVGDSTYLGGQRDLTLNGGQWLNGGTNLIVGYNNTDDSDLAIIAGALVESADGYIGWGSGSGNNSVLVDDGSTWRNNGGGLYVGQWMNSSSNLVNAGSGNRLTVQTNGWVYVGEVDAGDLAGATGGLAVGSTNGAELVVGANAKVTVEQTMYVGADSGLTGRVAVASGGTVSAEELIIADTGEFALSGTLDIGSGFDAGQVGFIWNNGGALAVDGALTGIDTFGGTNRSLTIGGSGSWDTTSTNLFSITGIGNSVSVVDGGGVQSESAVIGQSSGDLNNSFSVGGTGSVWSVAGDLEIGEAGSVSNVVSVSDQGRVDVAQDLILNADNTLTLASSGTVSVAGNMEVHSASVAGAGTIEFNDSDNRLAFYGTGNELSSDVLFDGAGGLGDVVEVNGAELLVSGSLSNRFAGFETLDLIGSVLGGSGTLDVFQDVNMSGGRIEPTGTLKVQGDFAADGAVLAVQAGEDLLYVGNSLDVSSMGAEVAVADGLNPSTLNAPILIAEGGVQNEIAADNVAVDEHYLLYDFSFDYSAGTNISVVASKAVNGQVSVAANYAALRGVRGGFSGIENAVFSRSRQLRRNLVATTHAIPNEAYLLSNTNAPAGAMGPGDNNTIFGMHFWAEMFSGQGRYDRDGRSDSFDLNHNGNTFGLDRIFGDALVVGVSYTYARSDGKADNGDDADSETYWLTAYAEWIGEQGLFVDALASIGWSDYETRRYADNYLGHAKYSGRNFGGHVDVGNYFQHKAFALAPYVGLRYLYTKADSHTEREQYGNHLDVGSIDMTTLESALGLKLRHRFDTRYGRFQTVGYAEWTHDFLNEDVHATLSDGNARLRTASITPDEDLFNTGIGLGWICTDYLEVGIGYDGSFSDKYTEHMGSARLNVMF